MYCHVAVAADGLAATHKGLGASVVPRRGTSPAWGRRTDLWAPQLAVCGQDHGPRWPPAKVGAMKTLPLVGAALLVAGLIFGFTPLSSQGTSCGSAFAPRLEADLDAPAR